MTTAAPTDQSLMSYAIKRAILERCGFVTGPNLLFSEGQRYRSIGVPSNVREADLFALIDAATVAARGKPPAAPANRLTLNYAQAVQLMVMYADDADCEITLSSGDGHSGSGIYAHYSDYPEEGAQLLDPSEKVAPHAAATAPAVPLTDDMVESEFVNRGDDKAQGLHPYWKEAFREGFNFARSQLSAAPVVREPLTQAASDVLAERRRQVEAEGWAPEHDDQHGDGSMALAAAVYALIGSSDGRHRGDNGQTPSITEILWPWDWSWFKPKNRRSNLIRAAALLVAEIERLDRRSGIGGGGNG